MSNCVLIIFSLDPSNNEPGTRADNDGPAVQYHAQGIGFTWLEYS